MTITENDMHEESGKDPGPPRLFAVSDTQRRADLFRRYGLSTRQYDWLLDQQGGVCAGCGEGTDSIRHRQQERFFVDHDHDTGAVRGLVCQQCNFLFGNARDRVDVLLMAVDYLQRPKPDIPELPDLCRCGEPVRKKRSQYCEGCWKLRARVLQRRADAEFRRRQRIAERGADVSHANSARTHCPHGHPYDEANTYLSKTKAGGVRRHCRICLKAATTKSNERRKAMRSNPAPLEP